MIVFFLPTVSSLHPVFCLCVCFPGYGTKRSVAEIIKTKTENGDYAGHGQWLQSAQSTFILLEQGGFGKALALQRCSLMFTSPLRTKFVHRDVGSLHHQWERYQQEGLQLQAECLVVLLCPIGLLAVGAETAPFPLTASIGCMRLSNMNLGPRNPAGKGGILMYVKAVKLPLLTKKPVRFKCLSFLPSQNLSVPTFQNPG